MKARRTGDEVGATPAQINARNREIWTPRTDFQIPSKRLEDVGGFYTAGYIAANATSYDAIADYYLRTGNFAGLAAGKKGLHSVWLNTDYNRGFRQLENGNGYVRSSMWQSSAPGAADGGVVFQGWNAAGVKVVDFLNLHLDIDQGDYHHILYSFDTGANACACVVDGQEVPNEGGGVIVPNGLVDYPLGLGEGSTPGWSIACGTDDVLNVFDFSRGCTSESFFHNDHLDVTDPAVILKFRSPQGAPVDLGARGQLPFGGVVPIYYSKGANGINLGSGGDLDVFGSPSACATRP